MPVNKNIGKLWFNNQEDCDAYDDKMMSNIRLKDTEDYEKPSYSILATREKKEKFFQMSEKGKNSIKFYLDHLKNQNRDYGSYKYWREWTIHKRALYYVTGYLILRELPIRRFYARSVIMAFYLFNLRNQVNLPTFFKPSKSRLILQDDGTFFNKYLQYDNIRKFYNPKTITKEGIDAQTLWKMNQPGSVLVKDTDFGKMPYLNKKEVETFWDGTMSQPVLPLGDKLHKDVSSYYWV